MASISNSIAINDGFSSPLNNLSNLLQNVTNRFTQLQNVMDRQSNFTGADNLKNDFNQANKSVESINRNINIVAASINAVNSNITNVNASINNVGTNIENAVKKQRDFNNTVNESNNSMSGLISKVRSLVGAYLGIQAIKGVLNVSDELSNTTARLNLINDGLQTTAQLQNMIYSSAQRSRGTYADTAANVARLGIVAKDAFNNTQEVVAFTELLNKQFKIAGATQQEMAAVSLQLSQALGSGVLRGDELNSVFEQAPTIIQGIADYLGKPIGEIRAMASEGQITAGIVKASMFAAADETNDRFAQIPKTFGDIATSAKNQLLMSFQPVLAQLNSAINTDNFNSTLNGTIALITTLGTVAAVALNVITSVGSFMYNNWSMIEPVLFGVIAALIVYNATMGIAWLTTLKNIAVTVAKTVADWAETAAILAMIVAQDGLNAALAACPITWILIGIIALIAIFYLAIAAVNKFAGTSLSATGMIVGAFFVLGASIYNVIAYLWNVVASFIEFFANVFTNPIYSVKALFANLATNVLDMCISMTSGFDNFATNMANAIISGINLAINAWNSFVDLLSSFGIADKLGLSKGGTLNYRTSITSDLQGMKGQVNDWLGDASNNYWTAPKMEMKSLGSAFDSGYGVGSGIENKISSLFSGSNLPTSDTGFDWDNLANNVGDIAGNTKDTNKKLDITEEDLKYLRDVAERDIINRFTTAEIKVDMTNHNTITNDTDIDGIANKLNEILIETMNSVAEGVS